MSTEKKNEITKALPTHAERFTSAVTKQFTANVGGLELTKFQGRLIQNYFIVIDGVLKKNSIEWQNVNMDQLALDVVACSLVGFDPAQPNHINMIPYQNRKTGKTDITPIIGYRGLELKSKKYGLEVPININIELVHKTDVFTPIKKDSNHEVEAYEFEIKNAFERGEIIGGFYFFEFENEYKNKLVMLSINDILKRKPKYAAAEFWGGEKDEWKNGKKTGNKYHIEGWYNEMCWKTIARAAYADITIDSQKIDDNFMSVMAAESRMTVIEDFEQVEELKEFEAIESAPEPVKEKEAEKVEKEAPPTPVGPQQKTIDPGF